MYFIAGTDGQLLMSSGKILRVSSSSLPAARLLIRVLFPEEVGPVMITR